MARKKEQCLCGLAFGDPDRRIFCSQHYDEIVKDRDAWKKIAEELLGHLESRRKLSGM